MYNVYLHVPTLDSKKKRKVSNTLQHHHTSTEVNAIRIK